MKAATAGETAAVVSDEQTAFYRQHVALLSKLAIARCGDVGLAEDLVHETFIKLFRRWPQRGTGEPFNRAYVVKTLDNCRTDAYRRRQARPQEVGDAVDGLHVAAPPTGVDAVTDIADEIRAAVRTLPVRQQEVIFLVYYGGWGLAEVAAFMNIGPKTVHNYHSLAKQRLAQMLSHLDHTEEQRDER